VRWFHSRRFKLRPGEGPDLNRASGDSGFVAHLTACTQGATGWDWSFRLVRPGVGGWVDPEAIAGDDIGSRIVKAIRRIAQLRRRLGEAQHELAEQQRSELFQLRQSVEGEEALGEDPLGELVRQLLGELSERRARLEMLQHL
jgi:hypothetical protein